MKKKFILFLISIFTLSLKACGERESAESNLSTANNTLATTDTEAETGSLKDRDVRAGRDGETAAEEPAAEVSEVQSTKIMMIVNGEEIIATMYDNPTSRDFLSRLPLTLNFEDYNKTEKISYLPSTLTTEEAPDGFDPSVGDLTLYAPWGNLAIFYNDFTYSSGLILLGHIDSGIEIFRSMNGDFTVTIEILK